MIYLKINKTEQNEVVAICDSDLIGKSFSEKGLILKVKEEFYKGEIMNKEEITKILKDSKNINIIGKESIKLALDAGIIEKNSIIKIKNVPHALVFEL